MRDSKTALTVALIGALVYSGVVTTFAYFLVLDQQEPEGIGRISLFIEISSKRPSYELNWKGMAVVDKGSSAYAALSSVANVSTKDYAIGKYITGIMGITEGNGWYWFYYIWNFDLDDWELAPVGVSSYKVSDGDYLRFEFEDRDYPSLE